MKFFVVLGFLTPRSGKETAWVSYKALLIDSISVHRKDHKGKCYLDLVGIPQRMLSSSHYCLNIRHY